MKVLGPLLLTLLLTTLPATAQSGSITGDKTACTGGYAKSYPCTDITLLSKLARSDLDASYLNDVWGWADTASGREFALVGTSSHVAFVEVTDPVNPVYVGKLPSHYTSTNSFWRDMKVYQDFMYVVVDGGGPNGLQIFDLTELLSPPSTPHDFSESGYYDGFTNAHNVVINEDTGFAFAVGTGGGGNNACPRGLHMIDLADPLNPAYAGCFRDSDTGRHSDGYSHDAQCVIYNGPDSSYSGREICIGFNENAISISDVTNKGAPVKVSHADYPDVSYTHQGWLTEDHKYVFLNDEGDEFSLLTPDGRGTGTRTLVWDVTDLDDPVVYMEYWGTTKVTDHNLYVKGEYVYLANYSSGLHILDISDIDDPTEVAQFDTEPNFDGTGYTGAWSNYPFLPSGIVLVNSDPEGLFVLDPVGTAATAVEDPLEVPATFALSNAYPNPFNPSTVFSVTLAEGQAVDLRVFDSIGREVAVIHQGFLNVGTHPFTFSGANLNSGTYLIRASGGVASQSLAVTLLK